MARVKVTGTGSLSVTGQGGTSGSSEAGVWLDGGGLIQAGTTGTATIQGTGGAASGNFNYGVRVVSANSKITSLGASLHVIGQGAGSGSSTVDFGVAVEVNGAISVTGGRR